MKNVVKLGLALAVFLTAFGVRANDTDFSVSVRSGLGKLINFSINNTRSTRIYIWKRRRSAF